MLAMKKEACQHGSLAVEFRLSEINRQVRSKVLTYFTEYFTLDTLLTLCLTPTKVRYSPILVRNTFIDEYFTLNVK